MVWHNFRNKNNTIIVKKLHHFFREAKKTAMVPNKSTIPTVYQLGSDRQKSITALCKKENPRLYKVHSDLKQTFSLYNQ